MADDDPDGVDDLVEEPETPAPDNGIRPRVPRIAPWRAGYEGQDLVGDGIAGLLIAVLLIPQALAYAQLAGLPPAAGISAAVIAPVAYALFAGSRFLAIGPVALVSLLVGDAVGVDDPVAAALVLAAMAGAVLMLVGALRLGFVFRVFTPPVLTGFMVGAAVVIATSQVGTMLGIDLERGVPPVRAWGTALAAFGDTNVPSALIGGVTLAALLGLPTAIRAMRSGERTGGWRGHLARALPLGVILATASTTAVLDLERSGVATLGVVGLPSLVPSLPSVDGLPWARLAVSATMIGLVAAVTTLAIARDLARRNGEEVSASRELFSLGLSSVTVSMFGGYPVGGSVSRSAVGADSGGRSPLAAVVGAGVLVLVALVAGDLLGTIPRAALSALIMAAAISMIDVRELVDVWHRERRIVGIMAIPFVTVVGFGAVAGVVAALVAGGIHLLLERAAHPG